MTPSIILASTYGIRLVATVTVLFTHGFMIAEGALEREPLNCLLASIWRRWRQRWFTDESQTNYHPIKSLVVLDPGGALYFEHSGRIGFEVGSKRLLCES